MSDLDLNSVLTLYSNLFLKIANQDLVNAEILLNNIKTIPQEINSLVYSASNFNKLLPDLTLPIEFASNNIKGRLWKCVDEFLRVVSNDYDRILNNSFNENGELIDFGYKSIDFSSWEINLFIRKNWWEGHLQTREHELRSRLFLAFNNNGCLTRLYEPTCEDSLKSLIHKNGNTSTSIAIVDLQSNIFNQDKLNQDSFLENLKKRNDLVVGILFDWWKPGVQEKMSLMTNCLDFIWFMGSKGEFKKEWDSKIINIPFPIGLTGVELQNLRSTISTRQIRFLGGFEDTNFSRVFWKAATFKTGELLIDRSNPGNDGLSAYESYLKYLDQIALFRSCLNFTARINGTRIVNGRIQEALSLNRLLISEYCKDVHSYYIPNEHFIEFASVDDLNNLSLSFHLNEIDIDKITNNATSFHDDRYSDTKILQHLAYLFL